MLRLVVFWNGGGGIMGALPNAVVKRLLTEHGGGLRVSGTALERAVAAAENYISRLAAEASASATAARPWSRRPRWVSSPTTDPHPKIPYFWLISRDVPRNRTTENPFYLQARGANKVSNK